MAANQPSSAAASAWRDQLKLHWEESAQLEGRKLQSEDQQNAAALRIFRVTSLIDDTLNTVMFLGIKMKLKTAANMTVDFVFESPKVPLPAKLDILQLIELFVDKQFDAYLRDKSIVVSSDNQDAILNAHRKAFEDSHMQAALLFRLHDNNVNGLVPQPLFGENNLDRFNHIASGEEKPYFVESVINGYPQFADDVFANYWAAKWFAAGHFVANATFIRRIFYNSTRRTAMRYFFDRILARGLDLHVAVLHDDVAGVRRLLEAEGADVDQQDAAGRTAVHLAASRRTNAHTAKAKSEILDLLLKDKMDIDKEDGLFAGSPLYYADMVRSWSTIDRLLRCRADTRHLPETSANPASVAMLQVVFKEDLDALLAFCLDRGLPVEYNFGERRLLVLACVSGSLRSAMLLIARGADINAAPGDDVTPLMGACHGSLDIVKLLISHAKLAAGLDASQHLKTFMNVVTIWSSLHLAIKNNQADIVDYLLREGADPWVVDVSNRTALHEAASTPSPESVALLLAAVEPARRTEYVNSFGNPTCKAMNGAAYHGDMQIVHLLRKAGGSLTAPNRLGRTPLIAAASSDKDNCKAVKYLIDTVDDQLRNEYVNAKDVRGRTALHWAALGGHHDKMKLLIYAGASVLDADNEGRTPLDLFGRGFYY